MKTKEELSSLKEEVEALSGKLQELSEDELAQVVGGNMDTDRSRPVPARLPLGVLIGSMLGQTPGAGQQQSNGAGPVSQALDCSWQFFD